MIKKLDPNNPDIKDGDLICGFEIKKIVELTDLKAFYYELLHIETNAKYIHISNSDKENTFSISFKTVPSDSTGVAHILEHVALCGSKRYPVRDPFFSMIKRSMKSFMNAFTASDWTMYPFSTQNKKDFYNLMQVYMDAAFFPNLNELSFKQEGHRLEFNNNNVLEYKGVVYNEMKGAMSSPAQVMVRSIMNALYPETTYSNNSGGDPALIPGLAYEDFLKFHALHYHPSNAYFYSYGNLPLRDNLKLVDENVLKHFKKIDPGTDINHEPRWKAPKKLKYYYPLAKNEKPEKKFQVCIAWVTVPIEDFFNVLSLYLIEQILLGNTASPLRKALIDSELGSSLSDGTGLEPDFKDTMFACGLKDVYEKDADKIEKLIFDTLNDLIKNGIDKDLIDSALHQLEFHRKEITNTPYPFGIKLLLTISGAWFHGADPLQTILFDDDLDRLKDELKKGPFLENQIKKYFIDNPHKVLLTLAPDQKMQKTEQKRVDKELKEISDKLNNDEKLKIINDSSELIKLQDSDEDISCLPTLELKDLSPEIISLHESKVLNNKCYIYDQPTRDILYFSCVSDLNLPQSLYPLIPFFCYCYTRIGTKDHNYMDMAKMIDLYTGGLSLGASVRTSYDKTAKTIPMIYLSSKSLHRNNIKMFDLINEFLFRFDFSNIDRIKKLLLEYKAGFESQIVQNGHNFALSISSKGLSKKKSISEVWDGINQFKTLKKLTDNITNQKIEQLAQDMESIANKLFIKDTYKIALIGEEKSLNKASIEIKKIEQALLKNEQLKLYDIPTFYENNSTIEGWATGTSVSFVSCSFNTVRKEHPDSPVLSIISKILRSQYLHKEIREKGGAYGAYSVSDNEDGLFHFLSYRDPHVLNTLEVYKKASDFICSGKFVQDDIKEAIIQVCSEIDKPDSPGALAKKAFYRKIVSLTDEMRTLYKERILNITKDQVIEVANKYFTNNFTNSSIGIISNKEKLINTKEKISSLTISEI